MKRKVFLTGLIGMALAVGLVFIGCKRGCPEDGNCNLGTSNGTTFCNEGGCANASQKECDC